MADTIIEVIAFGFFILALFVALYFIVTLKRENILLKRDVEQGIVDLLVFKGELEKALKDTDEKKIEETEGFLKFISQSRDWAFQYIERVQVAIKNFQDVFHPVATKYYQDKSKAIDQKEFGKLFEAYKKLIEELPDEGKKK